MNEVESHPWEPWLPENARVLFLGTFPPGRHRWAMEFYYPNPINDFWRVIGLLYFGDRDALYDSERRMFRLDDIKALLCGRGIAMGDSVRRARRLRGNASDKFLEVVEAVDLYGMLSRLPRCRDVAATGEKAAQIVAGITGSELPKMGEFAVVTAPDGREVRLWRMPSTSRAYPMALERKAEFYRTLLAEAGSLG